MAHAMRSLLQHRRLIGQMIATDLRGRYAGSMLGLFWSVVHPVVLVAIYTLVFSRLMRATLPGESGPYEYSVYLCAGFLGWIGFSEVVTRSTTVFHDRADLVRQVAFPKAVLHGSIVGAAAVNVALLAIALVCVLALLRRPLSLSFMLWPPLLALELAFAAGLGLIGSVVNVFFRDTAQVVTVLLQLWFWVTPIVYPVTVLPDEVASVFAWNPLLYFTRLQQELLVSGRLPAWSDLALAGVFAAAALAAGISALAAAERKIPDEL